MGLTVLVCGGRDFSDYQLVNETLTKIDKSRGIEKIVHGCATGADRQGEYWGEGNHKFVKGYHAQWRLYGNYAGNLRNQQMLDNEQIDLVVAFPGGRGTADMVRRAKDANIEVLEIT